MVIQVNKDIFEHEVLHAHLPVLVDFWGPQCRPCLALMPHVEELASERQERLKVVKVDASSNRRLCLNLKVLSLPTFLLYKDAKEVSRLTGNDVTAAALDEWIEKHTE